MGMCLPELCREDFAATHLRRYLKTKYHLRKVHCQEPIRNRKLSFVQHVTALVFIIYIALLIVSTYMNYESGLLAALSLKRNFNQLMYIRSSSSSSNSLECLNGIRVISMVWIVIHHCFTYQFNTPGRYNNDDFIEWEHGFGGKLVETARLTVDSFLMIAALLLTMSFLKARETG